MTLRAVLFSLLFVSAVIAQESPPIVLSNRVLCHGDGSDSLDCITPPRTTYAPDPKYPKKERKARHQGTVVLAVVVARDGVPSDIIVSRRLSPEFDQAAIDAVMRWKFSPATEDGKPVATKTNVEVNFRLY
jgi:TonB family protein